MLFYEEPNSILYQGHAVDVLKELPSESVDCVITSPPYWGLRTYKTEPIIWGDNHCEHEWGADILRVDRGTAKGKTALVGNQLKEISGISTPQGNFCLKCHAWKGELGLEPTIELYISHLLQIFDEVKRVLKKTGTLWVNLGDSYSGIKVGNTETRKNPNVVTNAFIKPKVDMPIKSLCLIPERFALGMVEQGWILRNNIIWYKSNPMPESVKDRFTGTYEYLYFFTKAQRYWFEQQFEQLQPSSLERIEYPWHLSKEDPIYRQVGDFDNRMGECFANPLGRNKRDVWELNTQSCPFPGVHFATFPEKLVETPILSGCPSAICKKCGKARERIYEKTGHTNKREPAHQPGNSPTKVDSTGWALTEMPLSEFTDCGCNAGFEPGVAMDIFAGIGTAGAVAKRLGRKYIGIELSEKYCKLHIKRLQEIPLPMELLAV